MNSDPMSIEDLLERGYCCGLKCRNCPYFPRYQTGSRAIMNEKTPNKLIKARVMTRPKSNTLDPQGVVVKSNLEKMGIEYLNKVSIGRYIELELKEGPEEEIKSNVQEAIDKLLYNSIIEDYEVIYESKNVK